MGVSGYKSTAFPVLKNKLGLSCCSRLVSGKGGEEISEPESYSLQPDGLCKEIPGSSQPPITFQGIQSNLLPQIRTALDLVGSISVVLDEDGTSIESEAFFQTLEEGMVLLALTEGQVWRPAKLPVITEEKGSLNKYHHDKGNSQQTVLEKGNGTHNKPRRRIDVACITFDLYKTKPQDFFGSLNVKATLYGTYSMSYDMQCYGAKRMMKEALRWTLFTMQATGHVLLGTSCYMQQLLDTPEEQKEEVLPSLCRPSIALPSSLTRRMLQ
ncbi:hypothetical protein Chor_013021 [Crotalus horridus]